jgi:hypothetical protein
MKKLIFITSFLLLCVPDGPSSEAVAGECVVVLHGMGRTAVSMRKLENFLGESGYRVVNRGYPSTSKTVEEIAGTSVPEAIAECGERPAKIHFVTHSLGGIVTRYYLQSQEIPQGSRIVMLSPPNKGSEIADRFHDAAWYQWLTGPPGQQLKTDADSLPNRLQPIAYETGIITGRSTLEPWFSRLIPGEDDGKVSVASARLDEMKDFLVVDHGHTFIMSSEDVLQQVLYFLRNGKFLRSK